MVTTKIDLGRGLTLKNPVLTASGTFGYGDEFADFYDINVLGGYIVKGTTLAAREGNDYPRMAETPSGMLNAVGLQNKGIDYFVEHIYPGLAQRREKQDAAALIVNVSGSTIADYVAVAERLAKLPCIDAIEVNISCPNVKQGGMAFGTTTDGAASVTRALRSAWQRHLMVKLSPNVTNITEIARAVEAEGADSVSLINTLLGMAVDIERRRPVLSTVTGGLSGPAVRPVAVRMVWQTAHAVGIPVVGLGGIMTARDAIEFLMAGARAIEVGTANFINPRAAADIKEGIEAWCETHGVKDLKEITGII